MILYSNTAIDFRHDVENNRIVDAIQGKFIALFGMRPSKGEMVAWNNSMRFMETVVRCSGVSDDCGVLIEYNIPATSKRVDFIITGKNQQDEDNAIIVELKQWDKAEATDKEDVVEAFVGGRTREMPHPSYQAYSYRQMLTDFNEAVDDGTIQCSSIAYLHNYVRRNPEPLTLQQYQPIIAKAPIYFKEETRLLQEFFMRNVGRGKGMDILYAVENGRIRPSEKLIDHVCGLFRGNNEFVLIDEQKVAYSTIINAVMKANDDKKTIIVKGGYGTGKSVVSMNAFGTLLNQGKNLRFIAPNASYRDTLVEMLVAGKLRTKASARALFTGSGAYVRSNPDDFDVLIVDEAHRLKGKGAYMYQGTNQVEDIVRASRVNVFFVDDEQRIRLEDIGTVAEIKRVAGLYGSQVEEIALTAQFRCAGAEGYINWIDTVLQRRQTGNFNGWDEQSFEFKIFDSPQQVKSAIQAKTADGWKARMLAGFAWKWSSASDGNANGEIEDVSIPEHDFSMPWNGRKVSTTWAVNPEGINQIGCVHTSQGLEFDYVGLIIGNDLKFDPNTLQVYGDFNEYKDSQGKRGLAGKPDLTTEMITNVYRILMSRSMRGCYVYCRDKNLAEHFKERFASRAK